MATPHINAKDGAFAETVLMPGDPLRAKYIAETYFEGAELVTDVRNMFGYTGFYQGERISVMGHGMGIPSCSIYTKELITEYGVKNIIRIGSAGAYTADLKVYDVVLAKAAYSESSFAKTQNGYDKDITYPSESLNQKLIDAAKELNIPMHQSIIHSSDVFYREGGIDYTKKLVSEKGCTCVEMESFALFLNAKKLK